MKAKWIGARINTHMGMELRLGDIVVARVWPALEDATAWYVNTVFSGEQCLTHKGTRRSAQARAVRELRNIQTILNEVFE